MIEKLQGDAEWPEHWCFYIRGEPERVNLGSGVTRAKNGALTYSCPCGARFTREPGFENAAAESWVRLHRAHLPQ